LDKTEEKLSGWEKLSTTKNQGHENRNPFRIFYRNLSLVKLDTFHPSSSYQADILKYPPFASVNPIRYSLPLTLGRIVLPL
jgi:hypothetical protein